MRKFAVLLAILAVVGFMFQRPGSANAFPNKTSACTGCHPADSRVSATVTQTSPLNYNYAITGPYTQADGYAVFNSSGTNILNGLTASGSFTLPAAGTYTFYGVNKDSASMNGTVQVTINATAPVATPTATATATATRVPPTATATATAVPPTATATAVPPTATSTAVPPTATATRTPQPTATATATTPPQPTATSTAVPTATTTPQPTATTPPQPTATNTPAPTATSTPVPTAIVTPPAQPGGVTWRGKNWTLVGEIEKIDGTVWTVANTQIIVDESTNIKGGHPKAGDEISARGKARGDSLIASSVTVLHDEASASRWGIDYFGGPGRADDD